MNKRILIITMTILCVAASVNFASAQDKKMKDDKMKDNPMMAEMEKSPHHKMMMAYRQNTANFVNALTEMAKDEKTFDVDLARTALAEIKRGTAMMDEIHRKHSAMMSAEMKDKMKPMVEKMETEKTELNAHIAALETILQANKPNLQEVQTHAAAIAAKFGAMKMSGMKM
jgi:cytochrome c556